MRQTWRWFGPADTISIQALMQIGVEAVVSALHHVPTGDVWTLEDIRKRQRDIAVLPDGKPSGLAWEVVESLPVSETIKTRGADWEQHISNYVTSLENLASAGLEVVCYNFMPVLDWTRTQLRWPLPHGGTAMRFDLVEFAVFDIHLLARSDARSDYAEVTASAADQAFSKMTDAEKSALCDNIVAGLPGANDAWTLADIKALLAVYAEIPADKLRQNLYDFLGAVIPAAERLGIRLCCHPDDPPFSILGLPRIVSSPDDYAALMRAVDSPANGITLCTGSMGVAAGVDFVGFIKDWGHRIHFAHLRNTTREGDSHQGMHSFFEDAHLEGQTDMVAVVRALLVEESRRRAAGRSDHMIPMRPDHGHELLDDIEKGSMPGYPLIGRMRGLAELRGIMAACA